MKITKSGGQTATGPSDWFTRVFFEAPDPAWLARTGRPAYNCGYQLD